MFNVWEEHLLIKSVFSNVEKLEYPEKTTVLPQVTD
jgi:hypothetical protein